MTKILLLASAVMAVTILTANWFVTATNAAPVLPKYGTAILRMADDGRKECSDNARSSCEARCKGRSNEQSCFSDCYNQMFNMCWGGG